VVNSVTTKFASDGAEEIEERDGSNNVLRKYVYGSASMIASRCSTQLLARAAALLLLDQLAGSTTTLVNQSGTLNATYHYGPMARARTGRPPMRSRQSVPIHGPAGRSGDRTLLLSRPLLSRPPAVPADRSHWTKDDLNLYAFTRHDPLNHFDPNGEDSIAVQFRDQPVHAGSHVIPQWISGDTARCDDK